MAVGYAASDKKVSLAAPGGMCSGGDAPSGRGVAVGTREGVAVGCAASTGFGVGVLSAAGRPGATRTATGSFPTGIRELIWFRRASITARELSPRSAT